MSNWYELLKSDLSLMQGDIIISCPILIPEKSQELSQNELDAKLIDYNVVVLSQSCDIQQKKLDFVLVSPIYTLDAFAEKQPAYKSTDLQESLRRGYNPGYHLLDKCEADPFNNNFMIVDFRNVYSIPFEWVIELVAKTPDRIRINSPYREHLSQAFARFFMRVGLPVDIPRFSKKPGLF